MFRPSAWESRMVQAAVAAEWLVTGSPFARGFANGW